MQNNEPNVQVKQGTFSLEVSWSKLFVSACAGIFLVAGPLTSGFWLITDHHNDGLYASKAEVIRLWEQHSQTAHTTEHNTQRLDDLDKRLNRER